MTVAEIKLQLEKQKEQVFEFNLLNEAKKNYTSASSKNSQALQQAGVIARLWMESISELNEVKKITEKAIAQAKELGVSTDAFQALQNQANADTVAYTKRMKAVAGV